MTGEADSLRRELEERLRFETLLADLSSRFVNLPAAGVDREISDAQRRVCELLDVDLSTLWQWTAAGLADMAMTHLYRPLGGPPVPETFDARSYFPWCLDQVLAGRIISISRVDEAPPDAARDQEAWRHYGLKSVLTFPLSAGGRPAFGALNFASMRHEREWPDSLVQRLRLVAEAFANALDRKRADTILRESEERLGLAAESGEVGMWMLDVDGGRFWANERGRELFGYATDTDITVARFLESVHPDHREPVSEAMRRAVAGGQEVDIEYRIALPDGRVRWIHSRGRIQRATAGKPMRLLGASVDVTERKDSEALQSEQLRFETLLADLSARFVAIRGGDVSHGIEAALGEVADLFNADRCGLLEFQQSRQRVAVIHAWCGKALTPVRSDVDLAALFPWIYGQVADRRRTVGLNSLEELPPEAVRDRESWAAEGVKSILIVPLTTNDEVRYLFEIQSLRDQCGWRPNVIPRLQFLGSVLLNALERQRADEELQRSYAEVEQLRRQLEVENAYLRQERRLEHGRGRIVGESPGIVGVLKLVEQVAPSKTSVLIEGETGSGKELVAHRIHELSPRAGRPMVKVNCAALPSNLVESELFGREKGAYTGAVSREAGRFEVANGSTLFLDEISELPLELQAKLLRVLEEGQFERVGSSRTLQTDVRVIAATNRDLQDEVDAGRFRRDLYFRLAVFPIRVPPLRERREDIPLLVWSVVGELSAAMNKSVESIRRQDIERLQRYDWPGNVRELRNVVERALILGTGPMLRIEPPLVADSAADGVMSLDEAQRHQIKKALEAAGGQISGPRGAAELLGMRPTTLRSRMQRLGLDLRSTRGGRSSD